MVNEHHKALCTASDHTVERGVRLQELEQRSETAALDLPEEFYNGLPSTADLKDDGFKDLSKSEAGAEPAGQGRQLKRPRTMRRLRPKDPEMAVSCG